MDKRKKATLSAEMPDVAGTQKNTQVSYRNAWVKNRID
jgi:hypothetical protein